MYKQGQFWRVRGSKGSPQNIFMFAERKIGKHEVRASKLYNSKTNPIQASRAKFGPIRKSWFKSARPISAKHGKLRPESHLPDKIFDNCDDQNSLGSPGATFLDMRRETSQQLSGKSMLSAIAGLRRETFQKHSSNLMFSAVVGLHKAGNIVNV